MMDQIVGAGLLETEVQALNRLPDDPFKNFVNLIFEFLLNPKDSGNLLAELGAFCETTGASAAGVKGLVRSLLNFLRNAAKRSLTSQLLQDQLIRLGLVSEKAVVISEQWNEKFASICRSIVSQVFMINQLVDMEWKFGVTAATSDMDNVGQSFLQLKLVINKGNNEIENVFMELTLPQFYSFMHEMEKAKAGLELLT